MIAPGGSTSMSTDDHTTVPEFEHVDWDALDGGSILTRRDVAFAFSLVALVAVAVYYHVELSRAELRPYVGGWDPLLVDWVFFVSLLVFGFYGLVPLVRNRAALRSYWRDLRTDVVALASLAWLVLFFVVGTLAPIIVGRLEFNPLRQPPLGFSIYEGYVGSCVGVLSNGMCHGSLAHPLGTTGGGRDVLVLTVAGMRTALEMVLITGTIVVPLGIAVGTVAGYVGGRVDGMLMRYVDVQQTIPALFIYMAVAVLIGPSLMLMIVVFGFLNWGNVARTVRSEVLRKRELAYVMAARNAGLGRWRIIRRHIVPNVSATVLSALTLKLPMLVIVEATLSFLKLGDPRVTSWGNTASVGLLASNDPTLYWWTATFPIVALALTAVAISLLGNRLQDLLDPRHAGGTTE